ncbi:hypothetical protein CAI21_03975 [Alkalilimnicola ehrlichii]|uniref:TRAP transporter solute receptor, TAXI family n=1 Tax=Alkalilimnicola ehrlichii TaxID=351052 RepID=A0A3E0X1Q2_9GAMM|nr:TAXI family TRAP transporter solute-binding subunit [Alkalilimnicola ehrlichii]RFA30683.1 hypothetical protein CAI21_03975 [Alkalilimnicola ehrlichii]RFA38262.1 hypothetical protein CAL65_05345 [Alkalilimnicola ehrlichii]
MKTYMKKLGLGLSAAAAMGLAGQAAASDIELPGTIIWAAYPTGTTGYSQAVGIGNVLQNQYQSNLRVVPGRNDVSRLEPLRRGRVHFSAGGTESISAQEGLYDFGVRSWGPTPLRLTMWNISDSCTFTLVTTADSGIETADDIKGKRIIRIHGAAAYNNGTNILLNYAGLTWDDMDVVNVGGYMGGIEALVDGRTDLMGAPCNSAPLMRLEGSPRGLRFIQFSHDDQEGLARVSEVAPWFVPHVATSGPTIDPEEGIQVFTAPYPMLVTAEDQDESLVYNMTKAIHVHYNDYQGSAPDQEGWHLDRQGIEDAFMPFHEGTIRYFKEIGVWTEAAQRNHEHNLKRQEVLINAWNAYIANAPRNDDEFAQGWMKARAEALKENGMIVLRETW